jgi:hypothetical protein
VPGAPGHPADRATPTHLRNNCRAAPRMNSVFVTR